MTIRFNYNRLYTSQDTSSSPFIQGNRLWCSKYRIDSYIRSISNKSSSGYILLSNQLFYSTRSYSSSNYDYLSLKSIGRSGGDGGCGEVKLTYYIFYSSYMRDLPVKSRLPKNYGGTYGFASPYRYGILGNKSYTVEGEIQYRMTNQQPDRTYPSIKNVYIYKVSYDE